MAKKTAAKKPAPTAATKGKKGGKARTTPKAAKRATRANVGAVRPSLLDAAYQVLKGRKNPMRIAEIYEAILAKDLWKPGKGKTPVQTLAAGIVIEINKKGGESRFQRVDRGLFLAR